MNWKDFLYFQRGSKLAVVLLLILIVLTLIFNAFITNVNSSELALQQNDSIINEFKSFNEQQRIVNYTDNSNKPINSNLSNQSHHPNSYDNSEYYSKSHNYSASKTISNSEVSANALSANANVKNQRNYTNDNYIKVEKLSLGETISLNSTDTTDWKKIPGIGSSYSSRIVKYRTLLGGFVNKEQLLEVYGIDSDMYSRISPYIEEDSNWTKIKINELEFKELLRHPYLNYSQVKVIVNLRVKKGDLTSINELAILDEFTTSDISRLQPYLEF